LEPNPARCKLVPIEHIDIAIIPGIAFDEKGGRIGSGKGYYDRMIPDLAITTRKVALAFEEQVVQQIPMESHDKHVDIIITDERIIYKI
jgi:5-formyltetrahydrofolate cyclo-ligase